MWDGKKSVAFKVFYDAIDIVEEKKELMTTKTAALEVWKDALSNVMPHVEVSSSRRVGGATFQIPMQIRPDQKSFNSNEMVDWLCS